MLFWYYYFYNILFVVILNHDFFSGKFEDLSDTANYLQLDLNEKVLEYTVDISRVCSFYLFLVLLFWYSLINIILLIL